MIRAGPAAGRRQQRGPKPLRLKQDSRRLNQKEDSHRSGFVIQDAGWGWGPASNGKTLFADLRDRVVGSVASGRSWSGDGSVVRGERCQRGEPDLTLRAVVAELAERGTPARCGASSSTRRSRLKKACTPASKIAPTLPAAGPGGRRIRAGFTPSAWCSSTRSGPRPT